MKTKLALIGAVATMALAGAGVAVGAGHAVPGTPGTANCKGQTMAYLNEAFKTSFQVNGIGNIADFANLTVKQVQDIVNNYCA